MNFDEFQASLKAMANDIRENAPELATEVESVGLRFVDDNFQNQSWEGDPWPARAGNVDPDRALLVKDGDLRSGFTSVLEPGQVRILNRIPYAKLHNEGFRGVVYRRPHKRVRLVKVGKGKKAIAKRRNVKGGGYRMVMPRRQFAPYHGSESPTLNRQVQEAQEAWFRRVYERNFKQV